MLAFELKSFKETAETLEVEITTANIIQLAFYLNTRREKKGGKKWLISKQINGITECGYGPCEQFLKPFYIVLLKPSRGGEKQPS